MKFQSKEIVYVLVLIAVSFLSQNLQAQVLDEVIVTAQKREQNLQDVGIAITAFSQEQIKSLGFSNTVDITTQTPNVQLYEWSPSYTVFNIRGVSQNDFADHLEPPIAVYVDDAYVSAPGALNGLLFDVKRVEVLRGPQGTLFGRNATGGLMHFISNKPTDTNSGYLEASFGDRNLIELEGAISGPIIEDKVLARVAVKYQEQDGYLKTNIRDVAAKDGIAVRGHLQFEVNDDVDLLLSGRWAKNDDLATGGYARDVATPGPDGLGVFTSRGDPFENTLNVRGYLDREIMGATGKLPEKLAKETPLPVIPAPLDVPEETIAKGSSAELLTQIIIAHEIGYLDTETSNNLISDLGGMLCDGAKGGCALKVVSSTDSAIRSAYMALNDHGITSIEGFVGKTAEETIQNLSRISEIGMSAVDATMIQIMLEKNSCHAAY